MARECSRLTPQPLLPDSKPPTRLQLYGSDEHPHKLHLSIPTYLTLLVLVWLVELDKNNWSRTNRMHLVLVVPFKYERRSGKEKGWGDTGEAKNAQKQGMESTMILLSGLHGDPRFCTHPRQSTGNAQAHRQAHTKAGKGHAQAMHKQKHQQTHQHGHKTGQSAGQQAQQGRAGVGTYAVGFTTALLRHEGNSK